MKNTEIIENEGGTATLSNTPGMGAVGMPGNGVEGSGDTTEPVKKPKRFVTYKEYLKKKQKEKTKSNHKDKSNEEEWLFIFYKIEDIFIFKYLLFLSYFKYFFTLKKRKNNIFYLIFRFIFNDYQYWTNIRW